MSLTQTNLRLRSTGVQNRVRRILREELVCDHELVMQNLRFDFIIESPPSWSTARKEMHLKKVFEQLQLKARGKLNSKGIILKSVSDHKSFILSFSKHVKESSV